MESLRNNLHTNEILKKYCKERGDEVVDALYIAAGWVADRPDVQNPLHDLVARGLSWHSYIYMHLVLSLRYTESAPLSGGKGDGFAWV